MPDRHRPGNRPGPDGKRAPPEPLQPLPWAQRRHVNNPGRHRRPKMGSYSNRAPAETTLHKLLKPLPRPRVDLIRPWRGHEPGLSVRTAQGDVDAEQPPDRGAIVVMPPTALSPGRRHGYLGGPIAILAGIYSRMQWPWLQRVAIQVLPDARMRSWLGGCLLLRAAPMELSFQRRLIRPMPFHHAAANQRDVARGLMGR